MCASLGPRLGLAALTLSALLTTTAYAQSSFSPTGQFGFRIDTEWSEDSRNVQEQPGGNYGHHVRFWPAKDRAGNVIN